MWAKYYFKMYVDWKDENILNKFRHLSEVKMLSQILLYCDKNTMCWTHTDTSRKIICTDIGIGEPTFKKNLSAMTKRRIFEKKGRGVYKVNENYISYGREKF